MREAWTDGRLDDLNDRVGELSRRTDEGFARVDSRFTHLETRVDARFTEVEARVDARFDSLQRLVLQVGASTIATTLVAVLGTAALR